MAILKSLNLTKCHQEEVVRMFGQDVLTELKSQPLLSKDKEHAMPLTETIPLRAAIPAAKLDIMKPGEEQQ